MEDFTSISIDNYTWLNVSDNSSNILGNIEDRYISPVFVLKLLSTLRLWTWITSGISFTLTPAAIYSVYFQVRKGDVASLFFINLLISDLLQLCCQCVLEAGYHSTYLNYVFWSAILASLGFMVCLALERYLVIAHPQWYHSRRNLKESLLVCLMVWVLSFVFGISNSTMRVSLFLPLPLLTFFLVGTLRPLYVSVSVPSNEKQRTVAILVIVLLMYMLLFLPIIIRPWVPFTLVYFIISIMLIRAAPLVDLVLYVLIRKRSKNNILASVCCCKTESNNTETAITGERNRAGT